MFSASRYLRVVLAVAVLAGISVTSYCATLSGPQANLPKPERLVPCVQFDPNLLGLNQPTGGGNWTLQAGAIPLFTMGKDEKPGFDAIRVIRFYKMNTQCPIGAGKKYFYYCCGDLAPTGPMAGEDALGFNPNTVEARLVNGTWRLMSGPVALLDFGAAQADADAAVKIVKSYGFNYLCFIGRPNTVMTYFRTGAAPYKVNITSQLAVSLWISPDVKYTQPKSADQKDETPRPDKHAGGPGQTDDPHDHEYAVTSTGTITSNVPCELEYKFVYDTGLESHLQSIKFASPGTQTVTDTIPLDADHAGWAKLKISWPVTQETNQATYDAHH